MADYETDDSSALAPNDPYKNMDSRDIRPNLSLIKGNKQLDNQQKPTAQNDLATAEQSAATNPISTITGGSENAKSAEQDQSFTNKVQGINPKAQNDKKKKGFLRSKGPIIAIVLAIAGGGGVMGGLSSLFPFHLKEQITELFDGSFTSRRARMPKLAKWLLNIENDEKSVTYDSIFPGSKQKYRRVSSGKRARLETQGVSFSAKGSTIAGGTIIPAGTEMEVDVNGTRQRFGPLETDFTVGSDDSILASGARLRTQVIRYDAGDGSPPKLITAGKYGDLYDNDINFRNDFNRGARTFVGRIAAWADLSIARFLSNNDLTRNLFKGWTKKIIDAEGADTTFGQIMKGARPPKQDANIDGRSSKEVTVTEEADGKTTTRTEVENQTTTGRTRADITDMLNNTASAAANVVCGIMAVNTSIQVIQAGMAIDNARKYIASILEASDKVRGGEGSESPINEAATAFMQKGADNNSAVNDEGMKTILSGGKYSPNRGEPNTLFANLESIVTAAGATIGAVTGCAIAKAAVATVSFILNIVTLGTFSIGKALVGVALSTGVGVALGAVIDAGISAIMSNLESNFCADDNGNQKNISAEVVNGDAVRQQTQIDGKSTKTQLLSPMLMRGACASLGANSYVSGNFRTGGGSLGTPAKVTAFYETQSVILAQEAAEDRANKNPFDTSTSHTFLGSLVSSIMPYIGSLSTPLGILSTFSSGVTQSLSALLPTASAVDRTTLFKNIEGNCPNLNSIGAVGDLYCNPIIVTDFTTIDTDPEDAAMKLKESGQLRVDENGAEAIVAKSNLGRYILYCSERQSPFGIVDQNISNMEANFGQIATGNSTVNTVSNNLIGGIPFVGDAFDVINSAETIIALPWSTGANCVARGNNDNPLLENANRANSNGSMKDGEGNEIISQVEYETNLARVNTIPWSEMKTYQRYVEDDRILQSADPEVKSTVTAFLDDYYEKNPLDQSYEGYLARLTGMTKENLIATLDTIEQQNFLATYDPTHLNPVPANQKEISLSDQIPQITIADHRTAPVQHFIIYTDTRNRNYAI